MFLMFQSDQFHDRLCYENDIAGKKTRILETFHRLGSLNLSSVNQKNWEGKREGCFIKFGLLRESTHLNMGSWNFFGKKSIL